MAVTKILARKARMDVCVSYVLNGAKTNEKIYTSCHLCGSEDFLLFW